jgi:hypothetical protein
MTNFNTYLIEMEITIEGIAMYNVHINKKHINPMKCINLKYVHLVVIQIIYPESILIFHNFQIQLG